MAGSNWDSKHFSNGIVEAVALHSLPEMSGSVLREAGGLTHLKIDMNALKLGDAIT